MIELLSLFAIVLVACAAFVALDRKDERGRREREAEATERQRWADRIQAPEVAPFELLEMDQPGSLSADIEDDEELTELRQEMRDADAAAH